MSNDYPVCDVCGRRRYSARYIDGATWRIESPPPPACTCGATSNAWSDPRFMTVNVPAVGPAVNLLPPHVLIEPHPDAPAAPLSSGTFTVQVDGKDLYASPFHTVGTPLLSDAEVAQVRDLIRDELRKLPPAEVVYRALCALVEKDAADE